MKKYIVILVFVIISAAFIQPRVHASWRNKHSTLVAANNNNLDVRKMARISDDYQKQEFQKLMPPVNKSASLNQEYDDEIDDDYEQTAQETVAHDYNPAAASGQTSEFFDVEAKRSSVIQLVNDAHTYLKNNETTKALHEFSHSDNFIRGEMYVFVFDAHGNCLAHGDQPELIWQNMYNQQDVFGFPYVQAMIMEAHAVPAGGWVTYQWKNTTKSTFVRELHKDNKKYIVGVGFYPHSKEYAVINMVKGAVALFNSFVKRGAQGNAKEVWSVISYPAGRFYVADLYLYAMDFDGIQVAHGDSPGLIGRSALDYKDETGKLVNQEIINKLKETDRGIWVEYMSRGVIKKAYAEKVTDETGKHYFIACGYYPTVDTKTAEELVKKGAVYMRTNGKTQATLAISDKRSTEFRRGGLYLFVYNMDGVVVAHGGNPDLIGENQFNMQDENGVYYVQEMIKKAKEGSGWVSYKLAHSLQSAYVELIDLGVAKLVVGTSLFPINKYETMQLLIKSGIGYLNTHGEIDTFRAFVKRDGSFVQGDLNLFVFDPTGLCFAYGDQYEFIWKNIIDMKDDAGTPIIKTAIDVVKHGADKLTFTVDRIPQTAYFAPVDKNGKRYIIGSNFFH